MEAVHLGEKLTEEILLTLLDQRPSSLFSFFSYGGGRMLKEINGLYVKLLCYIPFQCSLDHALPSDPPSMNCGLKLRNREDNDCFRLCYAEACHLAHVQSLYEIVSLQTVTNPETFSPSNPKTYQLTGVFEMPMAFNKTPRSEKLKRVQVNVFCYQKTDFIPLDSSKWRESPFILDNFLWAMVKLTLTF